MQETVQTSYHWMGRRAAEHHCNGRWDDCECDPMPHYTSAAATATELGLTLSPPDWIGYPDDKGDEHALTLYRALLRATSTLAVLKEPRECDLSSSQTQRAWEALRLEEAEDVREFMEEAKEEARRLYCYDVPSEDEGALRTHVQLLLVSSSGVQRVKYTPKTCFFVSDSADSQDRDTVEKWAMVQELTIGIVYKDLETEVIVAVEEAVVATFKYHEGTQMLLQCLGKVGVALELLTGVGRITRELCWNSVTYDWVSEFEDVADILAMIIGVAALSDFKSANPRGKAYPLGSSRWMPWQVLSRMFTLLPVCEGFVDLRDFAMHSAVMPVWYTHVQLLCPLCWITGEPNPHSPTLHTHPLHLVGSSDEEGYTAVSHLWSEFRDDETIRSMRRGAATVGGPMRLWIDKLCINQNDDNEKAIELSHMGSYYAGAHTTLICPARQITSVPSTQKSRHLVAFPSHLGDYKGLSSWQEDKWHDRVWTFQEAYLSKNPQVVNSETNTGLNACWLDFMAFAAKQNHPVRCEVGMPPFHGYANRPGTYGAVRSYSTPFVRGWAACSHHNWAPDISSIRMPLGKLLVITHGRKCTEEQDNILGILGMSRSVEKFRPKDISTRDAAYREAIRSGALGAEVLLGDLGGTSSNSSWIPKDSTKAKYPPYMKERANALQPKVDEEGRLICEAYEVDMDMDDRAKSSEWGTSHRVSIRYNSGTSDAHVDFHGRSSTLGKVYMLAAVDETDSLENRILVWALDTGNDTHHVEGSGKINWGHGYRNSTEAGADKPHKLINLRLG